MSVACRSAMAGMVLSLLAMAPGALMGQSEAPATSPAPAAAPADPDVSIAAPANAQNPVSAQPTAVAQPGAAGQPTAVGQPAAPVEKKTYTVPAGTKVLLQLRSAINTKSAKAGDGVYLASTFPVVVGSRVMIPAGVYVQGSVDRVQRAGHVKGRAQLDMHFTSIIFPNGSVVEIPGLVDNLPGASKQKVNEEGTIQQDGDKTRNMGEVAKVSVPAGGTVGSIAGLGSGHPLAGGLAGIAGGIGAAALVSLFTRGADVNIPEGTQVEMVLQRPLILEDSNLNVAGGPGNATALVPAAQQPKPLEKPTRARIMCPPGGLGCE